MSPAVRKILAMCETNDIRIVSYGLAPNPFGFCFERGEGTSKKAAQDMSRALDALTGSEEQELRQAVFGSSEE